MTINMGLSTRHSRGFEGSCWNWDGEVIVKVTPHIGHLIEGVEKTG